MASTPYPEAQLLEIARQLPSGPRILTEIAVMLRNPKTEVEELIEVLKRDSAMVARVLRVANSAAFVRSEPIGSIEEAILAIGFSEVHRVAGTVAAAQLADQPLPLHGISGSRFRENALLTACVMQQFGLVCGLDAQTSYTVGMLRTLGIIVLERQVARQPRIVTPFKTSGEPNLLTWQRKHWGIDGSFVTARILRHWNMPGEIAAAVECHLLPSAFPAREAALLRLAALVADRLSYGLSGEGLGAEEEARQQGGLSQAMYDRAVERALLAFNSMHSSVL